MRVHLLASIHRAGAARANRFQRLEMVMQRPNIKFSSIFVASFGPEYALKPAEIFPDQPVSDEP